MALILLIAIMEEFIVHTIQIIQYISRTLMIGGGRMEVESNG